MKAIAHVAIFQTVALQQREQQEPSLRKSGNIHEGSRDSSLKPGLGMQGLRSGLNWEQNNWQPESFTLMIHVLSFASFSASGSFHLSLKSGFLCFSQHAEKTTRLPSPAPLLKAGIQHRSARENCNWSDWARHRPPPNPGWRAAGRGQSCLGVHSWGRGNAQREGCGWIVLQKIFST